MLIKRDCGMIKLWDTAVENAEDIHHIVPALALAGALESHPEPRTPVYHYIPEVTKSDTPPWQPWMQTSSFTVTFTWKKSPCGNSNQPFHKVFRNVLSFKRCWFHFSKLLSSFHLLHTSLKRVKLGWSQNEGCRNKISTVIGKTEVTGVSPAPLFLKVKWI